MKNNDLRKLVTIKKIDQIKSIPNADKIELAIIGGWQCVVQKDKFKVDEYVLYFEIDSFLPGTVKAFKFLAEKSPKKVIAPNGKEILGHVLRTIKLRGEYSQGLIIEISEFKDLAKQLANKKNLEKKQELVTEYFNKLGVFKYERPLPNSDSIIGTYPSFTRKTDSNRVQNLSDEILSKLNSTTKWIATEKVDGSSSTWWKDENNNLRVASRNFEIQIKPNSAQERIAIEYNLDKLLQPGDVLKGELVGPGIQSNKLKLSKKQLLIFDWESTRPLPEELRKYQVPVYNIEFPKTVIEAVEQVDGLKSLINPDVQAEGVVWWNKDKLEFSELDNRCNFKAINNKFLLKEK